MPSADAPPLAARPTALARHELAAVIDAARGPDKHRPLSRRFLAAALADGPVRATSVPGGGELVRKGDGTLALTPPSPPKAPRTAQHARSLAGPARAALLEPGSYALFRAKRGHFAMGRDFPTDHEPLWPFHAKVYGAGARVGIRSVADLEAGEHESLLLSEAAAPAERRPSRAVGSDREKTTRSQLRLNLRYLEGELFP